MLYTKPGPEAMIARNSRWSITEAYTKATKTYKYDDFYNKVIGYFNRARQKNAQSLILVKFLGSFRHVYFESFSSFLFPYFRK